MQKSFPLWLLVIIGFFGTSASAQEWVDKMQDPNTNFYEVQRSFNQYWKGRPEEKGKGYKQFRRMEWFQEPRVYPSGDRSLGSPSKAFEEFRKYEQQQAALKGSGGGNSTMGTTANWTAMGPAVIPTNGGGVGRVSFVRFMPGNTNIIFLGTPAGGMWKSTDAGASWSVISDQLTVLGASDLAIDPINTNIMYLATGDGDAGDNRSIGVLKSTDGGATWATTGLTFPVANNYLMRKLVMNPNDPNMLFAVTNGGVFRTINGGANWSSVYASSAYDLEFKPGDPSVAYIAGGNSFHRSTNSGATFTQITTTAGIPTGSNRIAIGVTAANPAYVYLLTGKSSDSGFNGLYRSTDSGLNFTSRSTSPNILGWQPNGSDAGGQSWYDLSLAVSPTDAEEVITGGVNVWRSTNGGANWSIYGHWTGNTAPYIHADIHAIEFVPGAAVNTVFVGCDGGIFKRAAGATTWSDLSNTLRISQLYKLGLSTTTASMVVGGLQDNGTNKWNGTSVSRVVGGDGMECFIDRTNNNNIFAALYYGDIRRSTNGGTSFFSVRPSAAGNGDWVTPYVQDPVNATTMYAGYAQIWKTTNFTATPITWTQAGTIPGSGNFMSIAVAPSNNQVIYAARTTTIYRSADGGATWTSIATGLPTASAQITYIAVSPTNPDQLWVTFSGYSSGNKIFTSTNGGTSWANFSTGLPNLPTNCVVYENGSNDRLYVGTDVGVYVRDNSMTGWTSYFTGLPNVIVSELEIYYATGKIRAATYGRGLWESDLYSPGTTPTVSADFSANKTSVCPGGSITFTNLTTGTPTGYNWTFAGGTPATSTATNPVVTYATAGTYTVTLTATNATGSDTETKTGFITVSGTQAPPLIEGFEGTTFAPANWEIYNPQDDATWFRQTGSSGFGIGTASAAFDNYNVDAAGSRDALYLPHFNLVGLTDATLQFDVSHARYDASATYSDSLAVLVSTNCGVTFTQVWLKGGTTLATAPDKSASVFVPTATQWRTETINLNAYIGQGNVMISIQNRGHYGQMIYVDNVRMTGTVAVAPTANFIANTPTTCAPAAITFTNQSTGSGTLSYSWTFTGGTPATSTAANPVVTYSTPGTYTVALTTTSAYGSNTKTRTGYVSILPTPVALPLPTVTFDGFTGTNLSTVFPGWREARSAGEPAPSVVDASWVQSNSTQETAFGGRSARFNFHINTKRDWLLSPQFAPVQNTKLYFEVALTNWNSAAADAMGSDDAFYVMISTNCGATYQGIDTLTVADNLPNRFLMFSYDLSAYAGQNVTIALVADEGTVDDSQDYDLHVDNIMIGTPAIATTAVAAYGNCVQTRPVLANGSNRWRDLVIGNTVVGAVNDRGQNLGEVALEVRLNNSSTNGFQSEPGGRVMLDRYFHVSATNPSFSAQQVGLRLFLTQAELNALIANNSTGVNGVQDLIVRQYSGASEDCDISNNAAAGVDIDSYRDASVSTQAYGTGYYLQMEVTDHFSEFGVHGNGSSLPVTLLSFNAEKSGNEVLVTWKTVNEINNAGFEVQGSSDGRQFRQLGWIRAAGQAGYDYEFRTPAPAQGGLHYYRLRQVDNDGKDSYSQVRAIVFDQEAQVLTTWPNPFHNQLTVQLPEAGAAVIKLTDAVGRVVSHQQFTTPQPAFLLETGTLSKGFYLLTVQSNGKEHQVKVVKE
jgi:PKD repeat protein